MSYKKHIKINISIILGIISLLLSLLFVNDKFEIFLFFFIMFAISFIYNRRLIFIIVSKPIIKKICDINKKKKQIIRDIYELNTIKKQIMIYLEDNKQIISKIDCYEKHIKELELKEKQLKMLIMELEDKANMIKEITKQEQIVNRAIESEEITYNILLDKNNELQEEKKLLELEIEELQEKIKPIKSKIRFRDICNPSYINNLNGYQFEEFCVKFLENIGYEKVENTQFSNDYGVDIIAEKHKVKYAIQCKRYEGKVGNDAIQEVMSGKQYYNCNIGIVITNSTFTNNAKNLAKSTGVILWDKNFLYEVMEKLEIN